MVVGLEFSWLVILSVFVGCLCWMLVSCWVVIAVDDECRNSPNCAKELLSRALIWVPSVRGAGASVLGSALIGVIFGLVVVLIEDHLSAVVCEVGSFFGGLSFVVRA